MTISLKVSRCLVRVRNQEANPMMMPIHFAEVTACNTRNMSMEYPQEL